MRTLAALLLLAASSFAAATPAPGPDVVRLYRVRCAQCHGASGEGGSGPSFKQRLNHKGAHSIEEVIKNGISGTAMPPSGLLDPAIKKMAAYVLYLNKQK
jgi:mono/diheme cytochrome c family protein